MSVGWVGGWTGSPGRHFSQSRVLRSFSYTRSLFLGSFLSNASKSSFVTNIDNFLITPTLKNAPSCRVTFAVSVLFFIFIPIYHVLSVQV